MRNVTITKTPGLISAVIEHEATREVMLDRATLNHGWTISSDDSVSGVLLPNDNAMLALIKTALVMMDRAEQANTIPKQEPGNDHG